MITELTAENFDQEVLEGDSTVMVDFYSTYCEPCKRLLPIVEELAGEYGDKIKIAKFNIDNGAEIAGRYGIMGVPAIFFFKGGEKIESLSGFKPKNVLKDSIDKVLG